MDFSVQGWKDLRRFAWPHSFWTATAKRFLWLSHFLVWEGRSFQNLIKSAESYRRAHPNKSLVRRSEATVFGSVGSVRDKHRPLEHFCSTSSFRGYGGYQYQLGQSEEGLIPLGILEVVVNFVVRLLRGKRSTRVVLEISLQHQRVVIFASNQVIFIMLVHGNQGKTRVGFVISVPCRDLFQESCTFSLAR